MTVGKTWSQAQIIINTGTGSRRSATSSSSTQTTAPVRFTDLILPRTRHSKALASNAQLAFVKSTEAVQLSQRSHRAVQQPRGGRPNDTTKRLRVGDGSRKSR